MKFVRLDNTDILTASGGGGFDGILVSGLFDRITGNASITGFLNGNAVSHNPDGTEGVSTAASALAALNAALGSGTVNEVTIFYGAPFPGGGGCYTYTAGSLFDTDNSSEFCGDNSSSYNDSIYHSAFEGFYLWENGAFYRQ